MLKDASILPQLKSVSKENAELLRTAFSMGQAVAVGNNGVLRITTGARMLLEIQKENSFIYDDIRFFKKLNLLIPFHSSLQMPSEYL